MCKELGEVNLIITPAKTIFCPLIHFFHHMMKQHEFSDILVAQYDFAQIWFLMWRA